MSSRQRQREHRVIGEPDPFLTNRVAVSIPIALGIGKKAWWNKGRIAGVLGLFARVADNLDLTDAYVAQLVGSAADKT